MLGNLLLKNRLHKSHSTGRAKGNCHSLVNSGNKQNKNELIFQTMASSSRQKPSLAVDDKPKFPGSKSIDWTETLQFINPDEKDGIPVYRVMSKKGELINSSEDPNVRLHSY